MAAPTQPPVRRARSKSAKARLVTTKMDLDERMLSHRPDFSKSKRAQSAMGNKTRSEGSRFVLPTYKPDERLGTTHYEEEFEAKQGDMADVRPSSPTRRNNPHPTDEFMQWKVATRVPESRQGTIRPQATDNTVLTGIQERFYADYSGGNDGDMNTTVPITNVATIPFPGRAPQRPPVRSQNPLQTSAMVSGTRMQLSQRNGTASQKTRIVGAATKSDSTAELLKGWLDDSAKEEERAVVMDMLKSAATDDVRLKKALHTTLSPAAIPGVEQWLQGASEDEKKTVAVVFEELALRKRQSKTEAMNGTMGSGRMPPISSHSMQTATAAGAGRPGHTRRTSDPLPVARVNPPPMLYRHAMQQFKQRQQQTTGANRSASRALGSRPGSSLKRSHSHHGQECRQCETSSVEGAFSRMEIENQTDERPPITPMPAMLWHMYSKRDHTPNVLHRGAVFAMPQKYRGTHFDLTPEWPTV